MKARLLVTVCALLAWLPAALAAESGPPPQPPVTITPASQFRMAETWFIDGDFTAALTAYKQFLYFFPTDSRAARVSLRVGQCYAKTGETGKAITALKGVAENYPDTPSATIALFMISDVFVDTGQPQQALINLQNMMMLYPAPGMMDEIRYRMAWVYIEMGQWDRAKQTLNDVGGVGREDLPVPQLEAELARADAVPYKDPATAGALSIIPGGGQLYLGRHRDALVAFLLNGALIWAAVESFDNELYALGAVISVVEFGFYAGNIYGAVGSAHKFNRRQNTTFFEDLKLKFGIGRPPVGQSQGPSPALGMALSYTF